VGAFLMADISPRRGYRLKKNCIVIVDDHPLVREGLKNVIAADRRLEVVGEAGTAREGRRVIKDLKPDLVLLDVGLPDMSGIELCREIRSRHSGTGVMMISMHSEVEYIIKAFQAGAIGYASKEIVADRLLQAVHAVLGGDYFIDSSVSHQVVQMLMQTAPKKAKIRHAAYNSLTPREQEILSLLAEGHSAKEIADRLFISPKTVDNHRSNIMGKLGLHGYSDLLRFAVRMGLIDLELWKK
jgi:DNA-binding NarL/FixJ family response regulator